MTFAIVAHCSRTGRLGLAIASELISVGHLCAGAVRSRVGATLTLAAPKPRNNTLAIALLAQGYAPAQVLQQLQDNDPDFESRLMAVMDRSGNLAVHVGANVPDAVQPATGTGYVAFGHRVPAESLPADLGRAFDASPQDDLESRLLGSMEAVRGACVSAVNVAKIRSIALIVFGSQDYSDIDLRVDLHDDPIAELRRTFDEYQPFAAYYLERGKHPRQAIPQREFADMLNANRVKNPS
jgi:uncharacterized Ntn-hydrolase superfamily protein